MNDEPAFRQFSQLNKGDRVAVVSPAGDAASYFPWVVDQGLRRLRDQFGLKTVEYPTTRQRKPSPQDRARDLNKAFADSTIKAIFTTLGGNDQVRVLPYLNAQTIQNNPKPFFGFSDNTNVCQYLWSLGIPAYYGGAVMTQLAMQNKMLQLTIDSLNHALFEKGEREITKSESFTDIDLDWASKDNLSKQRTLEPNEGWYWDGQGNAQGRLWGGCVETLLLYLTAGRQTPDFRDEPIIIFLETAENLPEPWVVDTLITGLGERDIFANVSAVLVGRPKAWDLRKQLTYEERQKFRSDQRETIISKVRQYARDIPIIQNMDFGHTEPQIIVPSGNIARIDGIAKKVFFTY